MDLFFFSLLINGRICLSSCEEGGGGREGRGGEGVLMLRNIFQLMRTHENKSVWAHYAHA